RDRGQAGVALLLATELPTVHHRHRQVQQDQAGGWRGRAQPPQSLLAVRDTDGRVPPFHQRLGQRLADVSIIVHDEDRRCHHMNHEPPLQIMYRSLGDGRPLAAVAALLLHRYGFLGCCGPGGGRHWAAAPWPRNRPPRFSTWRGLVAPLARSGSWTGETLLPSSWTRQRPRWATGTGKGRQPPRDGMRRFLFALANVLGGVAVGLLTV